MDKEKSDVSSKPADVNVSTAWEAFSVARVPLIVDLVSKMRPCCLIKIKGIKMKYFILLWYLMEFTNVGLF